MVGVVVIMLVIGVAIGSVSFPMTKTQTTTQLSEETTTETQVSVLSTIKTETTTQLSTVTAIHTVVSYAGCGTLMEINGTGYCAIEVSNDIVLGNPGYSYFTSADAIMFNGVTFTTICPSGYRGCPNASAYRTITDLSAGDISLSLTFQDKASEIVGNVLPEYGILTILSIHTNPRARDPH